jgi:hypothetical protein
VSRKRKTGGGLYHLESREHGTGMDLVDVMQMLREFWERVFDLGYVDCFLELSDHPLQLSVDLRMTTQSPALAERFGFRAAEASATAIANTNAP